MNIYIYNIIYVYIYIYIYCILYLDKYIHILILSISISLSIPLREASAFFSGCSGDVPGEVEPSEPEPERADYRRAGRNDRRWLVESQYGYPI